MNKLKPSLISLLLLFLPVNLLCAETNLDFFFKNSDDYADVLVHEVKSADRIIIINRESEKESIKLIGLSAPKAPKVKEVDVERDQYGFPVKENTGPLSTIEEQSFSFVRELLENKKVRLEFDSTKKDEDNNTLAYVYLVDDNTFVNVEILRQGMADLQIRPPNTKYKTELRRAYQEARQEKRGLQGQ